MSIIDKYEKATVDLLNLDGWALEWCGKDNTFYDAKGLTPKGNPCVIEMKFRNKYYKTKLLEKKKYENLMSMPDNVVKIYFVNDVKGNYMYWLNNLVMPEGEDLLCPKTTMWDNTKVNKETYMLTEKQASVINWYEVEPVKFGVWDNYFKGKEK